MQRPRLTSPSGRSRTALYCRYSSHTQDQGTSIEVQLESCRRSAGPGEHLEYVDRAVSGTTMVRPAFGRMLADAEAGLIDTLYVYKFDRFGRSAHAHAVIADLEEMGVRVVSATEGAEPLSRGIQLVVAEDYSRKLAERVREAKAKRFEQGVWHGGRMPFGYRRKRVSEGVAGLEVYEPEAEVVRWIYGRFIGDSIGFKALANELTARGIKPQLSERWGSTSVHRIVLNPVYHGEVVFRRFGDEYMVRRGVLQRPRDQWQRRTDESLRIVPEAVWQAAQRKAGERPTYKPSGHQQTRAFSRLIRCAGCGATFVRACRSGDRARVYWACGRRKRESRHVCSNAVHLPEARLMDFIRERFARVFDDAEGIIAEATAEARKLVAANRSRLAGVRRELAGIEREIAGLVDRLSDPDLADPATKRAVSGRIAEKSARKQALEAERANLADDATDGADRLAVCVREAMERVRVALSDPSSPSRANEIIREFVGPMEAHADGSVTPAKAAPKCPAEHDADASCTAGHKAGSILRRAFWGQAA